MSDNPVMSKQRLKGMEEQLKRNPYLYKRDWLGLRVMPQGVIYSMFDDKEMTDQTLVGEPVEMFFAGDAGQNDATTLSCNIVTRVVDGDGARFVLNRVANYYHSGTETGETKAMSTYAEELRQFINWCHQKYQLYYSNIVIDPAVKTLRAELERLGIMSSPANNNGNEKVGSVRGIEVGTERLQNLMTNQQFRLVEPNSDLYSHYHFIKELGMYVRDENTGKPVDMNNHAMDEARYAANYFTSRYE